MEKSVYAEFEQSFQMYLPRICNHCINPACVAACPSGSMYKREEDGIVLVDQNKCRSWRMCVSSCPYKKVFYNWESGKAEKCTACYPRWESGLPTVCSESCVGRIRFNGIVLYDADRISRGRPRSRTSKTSTRRRWGCFSTPMIPRSSAQAQDSTGSRIPGSRRRRAHPSTRWSSNGGSPSRSIRSSAPCLWSGTSRRSPRCRQASTRARSRPIPST